MILLYFVHFSIVAAAHRKGAVSLSGHHDSDNPFVMQIFACCAVKLLSCTFALPFFCNFFLFSLISVVVVVVV